MSEIEKLTSMNRFCDGKSQAGEIPGIVGILQKSFRSKFGTHDNRILDVADRIVHMEDGSLAKSDILEHESKILMTRFENITFGEWAIFHVDDAIGHIQNPVIMSHH